MWSTLPSGGRARPGRSIRYRNLGALPLPADVAVLTCVRCRFEYIDPETWARLEPLLHEEYRRILQQRVRQSIDALMRHTSQRKLELLSGCRRLSVAPALGRGPSQPRAGQPPGALGAGSGQAPRRARALLVGARRASPPSANTRQIGAQRARINR